MKGISIQLMQLLQEKRDGIIGIRDAKIILQYDKLKGPFSP
jgi:hypothetical protein